MSGRYLTNQREILNRFAGTCELMGYGDCDFILELRKLADTLEEYRRDAKASEEKPTETTLKK